jgi:TRAP-type mannitol/chloroaromatic compound transport system permease small subunit
MVRGMDRWMSLARAIDRTSDVTGRIVCWFGVAMIAVGAFNALARHLSRSLGTNLSSTALIELQWYLFSLLFLLGAAYTLRHDGHVRVDVFSARLSARGRAWVDLAGTVFFLLPFCGLMLWLTWPSVRNSYVVSERSPDPGGLLRWPIKAAILLGFALLVLQALSLLIHRVGTLRGSREAAGPGHRSEGL